MSRAKAVHGAGTDASIEEVQPLLDCVEGLAEAHGACAQLYDLCEALGDAPRLHAHMQRSLAAQEVSPGQQGCAQYVFGRLVAEGQCSRLLSLPGDFSQPLTAWLAAQARAPVPCGAGRNCGLSRAAVLPRPLPQLCPRWCTSAIRLQPLTQHVTIMRVVPAKYAQLPRALHSWPKRPTAPQAKLRSCMQGPELQDLAALHALRCSSWASAGQLLTSMAGQAAAAQPDTAHLLYKAKLAALAQVPDSLLPAQPQVASCFKLMPLHAQQGQTDAAPMRQLWCGISPDSADDACADPLSSGCGPLLGSPDLQVQQLPES